MTGETLREFGRSIRRAPLPWLGLIVIAMVTDLVDLVFAHGGVLSDLAAVSLIVRFFGVFWLAAVALRKMMENPALAWTLDGGFVFFYLWQIALLVSEGIAAFFLSILKNMSEYALVVPIDPYVLTLIFVGLSGPLIELLSLKIGPWVAGRTARVPGVTFRKAWRGMRGHWRAAAKSYLVLVLPLYIVHYVLTAWIPHTTVTQQTRMGWALFDGVESVVMLMMLLSLYVACSRRANLMPERAALVDAAI